MFHVQGPPPRSRGHIYNLLTPTWAGYNNATGKNKIK